METISKKKTALLFAYNGAGFNGSQIQKEHEGVRTVEAELQNALFKSRCISSDNFGFLNKVGWTRASRTDKGVHALCAVAAMKMLWRINSCEEILDEINSNLPSDIRMISLKLATNAFNAKNLASFREYQYLFPLTPLRSIFSSQETIEKINIIAKKFYGTHSFHNYTRDILPGKPEAKRYVIKFELETNPVVYENSEYIKFIITGQSFLYHQIRKMIGMTVSVFAGKMQDCDVEKSFADDNFVVPLAPAEGLSLGRVHFTVYNKKQQHRPILITDEEEKKIDDFYKQSILPTIHLSRPVFQQWVDSELFPLGVIT
ncbi:hypothetical protein SteCoe_25308 [Stentor coeruleus]|uniref:Pseudouridine synthase I TruA alpha/beta domain-containing protein n=1 Tax=Stentor coeruleus TaxID=5963 RepID=A0A1R2BFL0_9CILI|nr:hypothetical protein SteCoe_25308 [Stentor coeruleus]